MTKKTKTTTKVERKKLYCCKKLTSWFRIGDYIVKHDIANYILGITDDMEGWKKLFVKHWIKMPDGTFGNVYNIEEIAKKINEKDFGKDGYIKTLLNLQNEIVGYEKCYYFSSVMRIPFDYKKFLEDKEAYLEKIEKLHKVCYDY